MSLCLLRLSNAISLKSVKEHPPSVSLLLYGGSFDYNEEYHEEFNELVEEAERKIVKEKSKKMLTRKNHLLKSR